MLEGGGRTPIVRPDDLHGMGFSMITYLTSIIFRVTRAIEKALDELKAGSLHLKGEGVGFEQYEEILGLSEWSQIETKYGKG